MRHGVGIGIDREDDTVVARTAHEFVVEVQPIGEGVDLQGGAGARGGGEHGVLVEINGWTTTKYAGGRMSDDVDVGMLDGGKESASHLLARLVEIGVHRGHQNVEVGEEIVIPVQGAVGSDVEFGAVQNRDSVAASRRGQLASLLKNLLAGHPLHRHQRGVVSDGAVAISMAGCGGDHVVQVSEAVGEIGVHVKVADDVRCLDKVG